MGTLHVVGRTVRSEIVDHEQCILRGECLALVCVRRTAPRAGQMARIKLRSEMALVESDEFSFENAGDSRVME
ncbi:MAG: hypothetical protein V3V11_04075 [Vicinamibacteria bacterium]